LTTTSALFAKETPEEASKSPTAENPSTAPRKGRSHRLSVVESLTKRSHREQLRAKHVVDDIRGMSLNRKAHLKGHNIKQLGGPEDDRPENAKQRFEKADADKRGFWGEGEPTIPFDEDYYGDDVTSLGHGELEKHRELREYARLIAWELPLLNRRLDASLNQNDWKR
jgi:small subunit ribosomal protein S35